MEDDDFLQQCDGMGLDESCVQQPDGTWTVVSDGGFGDTDPGGGTGLPGGFVVLFVLVALIGVGLTVYKVVMARDLARRSGMSEGEATALTLLDENGLAATYLASNLRPAHGAPMAEIPADATPESRSADRLRELRGLLDEGLVTQAEYDERRRAILDGI